MARIARDVGVPPIRIRFLLALARICDEWMWAADMIAPGAVPKKLEDMRDKIWRLVLSPRRPERS
jgi:hypothetical protein